MRLALIELPARFDAPSEAIGDVERLLLEPGRKAADLVLLPEAALTGYVSASGDFDLRRFAEPVCGPTTQAMIRLAARARTAIAFPLIEKDGDRTFNAFLVTDSTGRIIAHYRKRHPWYPETWATPGDLPMPAFEIAGLRMTLGVCFDIHFLEAEESERLSAIDVLLFPSAWVEDDADDQRAPILGHLANRFGVTIANANWGAGVPRIEGQGSSRFVGPMGELARASGIEAQRLDADVKGRASP